MFLILKPPPFIKILLEEVISLPIISLLALMLPEAVTCWVALWPNSILLAFNSNSISPTKLVFELVSSTLNETPLPLS